MINRKRRANTIAVRRGFSLVELMVAVAILGVIVGFAAPSFRQVFSQSRADIAISNLRAIWTAQRIYYLDPNHREFAEDLDTLIDADLLDPGLVASYWSDKTRTPYYYYSMTTGEDNKTFTATAYQWSNDEECFTIDQDGYVDVKDTTITSTFYD